MKDVTSKHRQLNNRHKITSNESIAKDNLLKERNDYLADLMDEIDISHNELKNFQELIANASPRPYQKSINIRESQLKQRNIDIKNAQKSLAKKVDEINGMASELKEQLNEMQENFDKKSSVKPYIDITYGE